MQGYRMVFDWENMKLGWSHSSCKFELCVLALNLINLHNLSDQIRSRENLCLLVMDSS